MTDSQPLEERPVNRTSFGGDILKVASGTTIAQALNVLSAPLLAWLFAPEAFGIFTLFYSITGVLVMFFTLQYELAIMLPKQDEDAVNLVAGSLGIATFFSLLLVPVIGLMGPTLAGWLNAPQLSDYLWLVPLVLFFGGLSAGHPVLNAWAGRTRNFAQVASTQVTGSVVSVAGRVVAGLSGFNSGGGLIVGNLAGSIISPVLLGWQVWRRDGRLFLDNVRWRKIWENLKRYRKFAIFNTPSALLNNISWQVPSFLLSAFFSPTVVGYYAFGNQLLRVPMSLVGGSIAQAFFAHAATANQEGTLAEFVENTFRRLVEYSFFPILMLAMVSRELFVVIFGSGWAEAGVYTQILSLWMVFWFVSSPMSRLYSVLERNELSFGLNTAIFITRVLSIWVGGVMGSPRIALLLFSLSGAVLYGYLSVSIILLSGVSWRRIGRILFENIAVFVPVAGVMFLLKLPVVPDWVQVVVAILFVGIYYLYRLNREGYLKKFLLKMTGGKSAV
ncbi:MAG: oligosaccharide flippase family protein [Chloroflexi bacterium]|nr:oligosaccharide flippase family protein [Chloroflexota bacterium]